MNKPRKIHIDNLAAAAAQEVFDHVAFHLLTQNERAVNKYNDCKYRVRKGNKTLKCAAGSLIPESKYSTDMEGASWRELRLYRSDEHVVLIIELQKLHDMNYPEAWKQELKVLASRNRLSFQIVEQFK